MYSKKTKNVIYVNLKAWTNYLSPKQLEYIVYFLEQTNFGSLFFENIYSEVFEAGISRVL